MDNKDEKPTEPNTSAQVSQEPEAQTTRETKNTRSPLPSEKETSSSTEENSSHSLSEV